MKNVVDIPAPLPILNISAYQFVAIADPCAWRELIAARAANHGLLGTVLLAGEGINLFLAGAAEAVRAMLGELRALPGLADLDAKESWSATLPFKRLKVRVKREIIRMDHPQVVPAAGRAPSVSPQTLARWLDAGRDDAGREVVMVDTRNAFEVDYGRFRNALDWRIERFTQFPAAVAAHREALAGKTVVSYCTGGIRCEKAALHMRDIGIDNVLQLEGGILRYFEHVGDRHYEGDCFVFDQREALDPTLAERQGQAQPASA